MIFVAELGINFDHIVQKVSALYFLVFVPMETTFSDMLQYYEMSETASGVVPLSLSLPTTILLNVIRYETPSIRQLVIRFCNVSYQFFLNLSNNKFL